VLVQIARGRSSLDPLPQLAQQLEQLFTRCESPWHQAGRSLGGVPAAEVLDDRLWVHRRLGVRGELAHRRGAPQSLRARLELLDDVLVAVALADPSLELGESVSVEGLEQLACGPSSHGNKDRADSPVCKCGRAALAG